MPLKQERTSYSASNNLKTALSAKGFSVILRMYVEEELQQLIASIPGVSSSSGSQGGLPLIWTWTITRNGTEYTRTDTKKADAICKAITAVVNAL